jgi:23S rRNA-/tRNA-specific pseudouridylate synthase
MVVHIASVHTLSALNHEFQRCLSKSLDIESLRKIYYLVLFCNVKMKLLIAIKQNNNNKQNNKINKLHNQRAKTYIKCI